MLVLIKRAKTSITDLLTVTGAAKDQMDEDSHSENAQDEDAKQGPHRNAFGKASAAAAARTRKAQTDKVNTGQSTMCVHVSCVHVCVRILCVGAQNVDTQLFVQLQKKGKLDLQKMVKQASAVQLLHGVHACVLCVCVRVCAWHCVRTRVGA